MYQSIALGDLCRIWAIPFRQKQQIYLFPCPIFCVSISSSWLQKLLLWIKLLNTFNRTPVQRKLRGITVKIQTSGISLPLAETSVTCMVMDWLSQSRLKQRLVATGLSVL